MNKKMTNKYWLTLFFSIMILSGAKFAMAVPPDTMNYQGHLTDSSGVPVDGSANIVFSIYNLDAGGFPLWVDSRSVIVDKGVFSVELGGGLNPFPAGLFESPLWMGLTIGTDAEMTPRRPVSSVAFSFKASDADTLEGISAATLDQSAHVGDTANPHSVTAAQVGAASTNDITSEISTHAADDAAHHTKTENFTDLSGQAVDAQIPALIARDTEITWSNLAGKPTGFADGVDNDSGGDITSVGVNTGLVGGGSVGDVLLAVAVPLTLSGSSVNPIISGQNAGSNGSAGVKGINSFGPTNGYLGLIGASDFEGITALDIPGFEIGVMGLSTGTSVSDNYGLYGYSNNIGIYAEGATQAGVFIGDVVIGTGTGGSEKLVVQGDGTAWSEGFLAIKNVAEDAGIRIYDGDTTTRFHIFNDNSAGDELRIVPEDTYNTGGGITIMQNGFTGVGATNPNSTLHVNGDGVAPSFRSQVSGSTKFIVAANGGIGIGGNVETPDTRLQLVGGSDATLTTGSGYAQIGYATGENIVIDNNEIMARNNGVKSRLYLNKDSSYVVVPGLEITGGADLVEPFDVASDGLDDIVVPGMVVSINPEQPGKLKVAQGAYDRTVAGIISGANGIKPGLSMAQQNSIADGSHPVALTGRLYALADASFGAIEPGDMLTTSDTLGHVMKVTDHNRAQGAIIGKAMTSLDSGKGHVLVLVTLQ